MSVLILNFAKLSQQNSQNTMDEVQKSEKLKEIASNVTGNSIGDVMAVQEVITAILKSGKLSLKVTERVVDSVSFLLDTILDTRSTVLHNIIVNRYIVFKCS